MSFLLKNCTLATLSLISWGLYSIEPALQKLQENLGLLANTIAPITPSSSLSSDVIPFDKSFYAYLKHIAQQSSKFKKSISWHYLSQIPLDYKIDFTKLGLPKVTLQTLHKLPKNIPKALSLKTDIKKLYANNHLPLEQFFSQEVKFADTHEVFYHAHTGPLRILHDLFTSLANFFYQYENKDFIYLRDGIRNKKAHQKIIDATKQAIYLKKDIDDMNEETQKGILSVNVHLFGNVFTDPGSSTILYYAANRSQQYNFSWISKLLKSYELTENDDFKKILNIDLTGNLLQIFIPKKNIKDRVFLAISFGGIITTNPDEYYPLIQCTILNVPKEYCSYWGHAMDLQVRILLDNDIMLNPNSGVKIFRYTQDSQEINLKYNQELKKAIHKMLIDWLERLKRNEISQELLQDIAQTPLGKKILELNKQSDRLTPKQDAIDDELKKLRLKSL